MMYQLVCIALNTKISELPTEPHELRKKLKKIEKLKHVFFAESYKFFKFVKTK